MASRKPPRLSLFEVIRDPARFRKMRTEILMEATLRHGDVVRLPTLLQKMFVVTSPDAIKRVLVENAANYGRSDDYLLLQEWVGRGLITTEGDVWRSDRKRLQPTFSREALQLFSAQIVRSVDEMLRSWNGVREVDVSREMMNLSLVLIGWRLFGKDIGSEADRLSHLMEECQSHICDRLLSSDLSVAFFQKGKKRFERNRASLDAFILEQLQSAAPESIGYFLMKEADASGGTLDVRGVVDHILGFLVAGHETTATALTWTLLLLAQHAEIQERARSSDDLYLRTVIEESMRLYPPIPCFSRKVLAPDVLAGCRIPGGAKIILSQHVTHRRPDLWEDPERFDPERFSAARRGRIVAYSYFPFGFGSRACIGQQMALMELQVTLRALLERFQFTAQTGPQPRPVALISLKPDRPVVLGLNPLQVVGNEPRVV